MKKPLYKRWYVWFLVLAIIGGIASVFNDDAGEVVQKPQDAETVRRSILDLVGEDEEILDVTVEGNNIFIKVDLGEEDVIPIKDLAITRYSSITDKLLKDEYWNNITVEFVNVGNITMNTKDAIEGDYGKYFDSIDIENNFKPI